MDQRFSVHLLIVLLSALLVLSILPSATGSHEPNHRFTVSGKVTDALGIPVECIEVKVDDVTAGISKVEETGRGGSYSVTLHLHDNNVRR